ncbi:hypothetical protein AO501_20245 [Mycobacterium gordonae]|uniref:PPE family protein n=1 Tax=Mycobacterium gordonae TaxID=1778 RepID=A0A0Q2R9X4_MYCGO|nr:MULTISPECIES: PPE family protein [Mycobacterium]KQH80806.1 hypothetical protein AO501_20245 [Mycobacterium gordonae]MDP7732190.1 PPE family protein [Mycobacterium sp. TY813]
MKLLFVVSYQKKDIVLTSPHYSMLPPEVNSTRVFTGTGPAPILAAAAAWDVLGDELHTAAASFGSLTSNLAGGTWHGPASTAMTRAAAPYLDWLSASAAQAQGVASLARAAAAEFDAALAASVHPAAVAVNRAQVFALVSSNIFGQNTPAIAAIESIYEEMWAQDVSAMACYHTGSSALVAELMPWQEQLQSTLGSARAAWSLPVPSPLTPLGAVAGAVEDTVHANTAVAQTVGLVMGGSGAPIPPPKYVQLANDLYISRSIPGVLAQPLFTPQGLYPVIAVKNLTFDMSVAQGMTILESAIRGQIAAGNNVAVFGFSQSATISGLTMANLAASINPPTPDQLSFILTGNPNNPNGGVATRFPGISFPSLGVTPSGPTPDNLYPTKVYTIEYDGVADFPRYPINALSTLNALAGIYYVHSDYLTLTPAQLDSAIQLTNTVGPTMTEYYIIPTANLPLLEPLRAMPILGNPLADLVQPNLKVIVNLGYGDPGHGYSTSPPNVATPFGLFPEVSPLAVVDALTAGTQQGIADFGHGMAHISLPQPTELPSQTMNRIALLDFSGVRPGTPVVSLNNLIDGAQAANTNLIDTVSKVAATSYAVFLPTADFANAVVTSGLSYNVNLYLEGIQQAINGDPMGFVNAIGYPLAADVALIAGVGLLQTLVLVVAGQTIANDISTLIFASN